MMQAFSRKLVRLLLFAVACAAMMHGRDVEAQPAPRNIVLILSDDHRYDFMGFMGKPAFLKTPAMDRMAAEGAHVQNAMVTTALCSPSRASILTGQYAHRHGVVDNNTAIPAGTVFFPRYLKQAGYETAFFGKWHMGGDSDAPQPGFDRWVSFRGQGDYYNPTLNIDGERRQVEGYTTDLLTDLALDWMKQKRSKPFFLMLAHKAVHAMFEPAARHAGRYADARLEYPASMANIEQNYRGKPRWVREQRYSWHGVDYMYYGMIDYDTFFRRYNETLLALDESIGRVTDYLRSTGLDRSTLVVYMSDNGFLFGEHGLIDKRHMYEESIRVPMLVYAPGLVPAGSRVKELVRNIDVAPTLLEVAGVPLPQQVDGRSFLPLLRGNAIPWRNELLYEYYWERDFPQTPTVFGLRDERYKYIFYHGIWDTDELYDLELDPKEQYNLIDSPDQRERVQAMQNRLFQLMEETGSMSIPLRRPSGFVQGNRVLH